MTYPYDDPESLREPLEQILDDAQGNDSDLLGNVRGQLMLMGDLFNALHHHMHSVIAHSSEQVPLCHACGHMEEAARISALLSAAVSVLEGIEFDTPVLPSCYSPLGQALVDEVIRSITESTRADAVGHLHRCLGGADDSTHP